MIYSLNGKLIVKEPNAIVVECGGVGYRCAASLSTIQKMPDVGQPVQVFTHMAVREDSLDLFAFADQEELACFRRLISVSGVGPKVGLAILSDIPADRVDFYIVTGDAKSITKAQGVGPKLAQRIVLELKDKVALTGDTVPAGGPAAFMPAGSASGEAVSALVSLGYSQSEAAAALAGLDPTLPVEELIRRSLKKMM